MFFLPILREHRKISEIYNTIVVYIGIAAARGFFTIVLRPIQTKTRQVIYINVTIRLQVAGQADTENEKPAGSVRNNRNFSQSFDGAGAIRHGK